jgi:hypothetical protein
MNNYNEENRVLIEELFSEDHPLAIVLGMIVIDAPGPRDVIFQTLMSDDALADRFTFEYRSIENCLYDKMPTCDDRLNGCVRIYKRYSVSRGISRHIKLRRDAHRINREIIADKKKRRVVNYISRNYTRLQELTILKDILSDMPSLLSLIGEGVNPERLARCAVKEYNILRENYMALEEMLTPLDRGVLNRIVPYSVVTFLSNMEPPVLYKTLERRMEHIEMGVTLLRELTSIDTDGSVVPDSLVYDTYSIAHRENLLRSAVDETINSDTTSPAYQSIRSAVLDPQRSIYKAHLDKIDRNKLIKTRIKLGLIEKYKGLEWNI